MLTNYERDNIIKGNLRNIDVYKLSIYQGHDRQYREGEIGWGERVGE